MKLYVGDDGRAYLLFTVFKCDALSSESDPNLLHQIMLSEK